MSLSPEELRFIAEYTASVIGKINQVLANRITTTFTNSNDVIPSSKLVKDEFAAVRSEMPTNTSDLTNDGADGTNAFIVEGDSRLDDTRNPKPHNQASSTITDTNTYSNIGNTLQNQASINSAINEKIGALMNLDLIEQVTTRPTASADTLNKIYALPENDPTSENLFQYFITVYEDNAYKWDKIDLVQVDISGKVDKVEGKQLSTEDYTSAEKSKLANIEPEANKTIVDSTFINNSTNPVQSKVIQTSLNSKANTSDLAAVATSGNYNDLSNKPNVVEKSVTSGLIKNDGTIDTNQYLTSANMPESFNYGYVDSNLVLHLICVDGEVRVLHSIIQSGDPNIISAVITDKDNNPLGGVPVDFLFNGVKQGQSVNSDANGVATYNYTGTGAGEVDVQVRVGNFLSEPYETLDCTIYEVITSTTHQNLWYASANVSITYTDNGVNFKGVNTSTDRIRLTLNNDKLFLDLDSDWCLELDVTSANLCSFYFTQADNETGAEFIGSTGLGLETGVKSTAKFEYSATNRKVSCYLDGTYKNFLDLSNFTQGIGFRVVDWQGDADITFQNIKVYPI